MKVILLEKVDKLGRKYDIVNVKDGYALNFLFPKKYAERATAARIEEVQKLLQEELVRKEEILANAAAIAKKLDGKTYKIEEKVSDKGHLFGSVAVSDVLELLKEKEKVELDKDHVKLDKPIKEVGEHKIALQLTDDATAEITLDIQALKEDK